MSTVTKLGVYGLAVVAAFAVAFAVLVTAPRSSSVVAQTAEDQTPMPHLILRAYDASDPQVAEFSFVTCPTGTGFDGTYDRTVPADGDCVDEAADPPQTAQPADDTTYPTAARVRAGESVYIQITDLGPGDGDADPPAAGSTSTLFRFSVSDAGESTGTFKEGGKTTLNCADGRTCDLDGDSDDIIVQFDVASDAAANTSVVLNVENINDDKQQRIVIEVTGTALAVSGINLNLASGSSTSRPARYTGAEATGEAVFEWGVQDNQSEGADDCRTDSTCIVGQEVFFTITGATFRTNGVSPGCSPGSTSCRVQSDADGGWVQVRGSGAPGVAKLTVEAAGFTVTKDVTFYGTAKTITAEAEQNSVEVGGKVFIVVTVTDGAGNGISGRSPARGTGTDSVKGPSTNAIKVVVRENVAKDPAGTANDIPACASRTNVKGQCVLEVEAPNPTGTANDAARGNHVITVVGKAPIAAADRKVQVTITVAGAVNAVNTNAPDRVDPGSTTEITATVVDDEGVRAGAQSVTVTKISGDGVLRNGGPAVTKDGQLTFSYRAASNAGTAEFDVEVRAPDAQGNAVSTGKVLATTSFTIRVGEEAPPEPETPPTPPAPERPTLTPPPYPTGFTASTFSGGSTSDLQEVLLNVYCNNTVSAYATSRGVLVPYIPASRIAAANAAFLGLFSDGMVPAGTNVIVGNCGNR